MTNETTPEPIFPLGFSVETNFVNISIIDKLVDSNPKEVIELIKILHDRDSECRKEHLKNTIDTQNKAETTKRLSMILAFGLFLSLLIYSSVSGDKALTEKIAIGLISAVAGVGGGVLINQQKDK